LNNAISLFTSRAKSIKNIYLGINANDNLENSSAISNSDLDPSTKHGVTITYGIGNGDKTIVNSSISSIRTIDMSPPTPSAFPNNSKIDYHTIHLGTSFTDQKDELAATHVECAEWLLCNWAMYCTREAAVNELIAHPKLAHQQYQLTVSILDVLRVELPKKNKNDLDWLSNWQSVVQQRIDLLNDTNC
jgi:hypothetical protein